MASATGCAPGPGGPSSTAAGPRGGSASPPERRRYGSLHGAKEFQRVRRIGRRRRIGGITLIVADGGPASPLVGIVAGQSVGSAVARNRAKRRLREVMARAPLRGDRDYLVVAGRSVLEAAFPELTGWVLRALEEQGE